MIHNHEVDSSILSRATSTDIYIFVVVCFLYLYSRYEFAKNSFIIQYGSRTEADQINFKQNPHQYPIPVHETMLLGC